MQRSFRYSQDPGRDQVVDERVQRPDRRSVAIAELIEGTADTDRDCIGRNREVPLEGCSTQLTSQEYRDAKVQSHGAHRLHPRYLHVSGCLQRVGFCQNSPWAVSFTMSLLSINPAPAVAAWKVGGGESAFGCAAAACSYGTTTSQLRRENINSRVYAIGSAGAGAGSPAPPGPQILSSKRLND